MPHAAVDEWGGLLPATSSAKAEGGGMADRPNLLFILSDQHSQGVAGCYGDPIVETPNLDRLAASGVILRTPTRRAHSAYLPVCHC